MEKQAQDEFLERLFSKMLENPLVSMVDLERMEMQKQAYKCKCGHIWVNRPVNGVIRRPRLCPKCKSVNWDRKERDG